MARILLLGPEKDRANGVRNLLRCGGHEIVWSRTLDDTRELERDQQPDLIVAAVEAPNSVKPAESFGPSSRFPPPLLFVQQESDFPHDVQRNERLVDRIASPFTEDELLGRVDALVRVRQIVLRREPGGAPAWHHFEGTRRRGVLGWLGSRPSEAEPPVGQYVEVATRLADWADRRDTFRPGHAERVASFSGMIAETLTLAPRETSELLRAAMLHDIGKVTLPVEVLHQRTPLDEHQLKLIRQHPARGAALLRALDPDEHVARVVLFHHERPDGRGYYGKPADAVPRAAHVLAVAEAYDAMTSSQVQEPLEKDSALDLLRSMSGERYDRECVNALIEQLRPRATCIPLSNGPIAETKIDPWVTR